MYTSNNSQWGISTNMGTRNRGSMTVNNLRRQSRFDHGEINSITRTNSRISIANSDEIPDYPKFYPVSPYNQINNFNNRVLRDKTTSTDKTNVHKTSVEKLENIPQSSEKPLTPMNLRKYCCSDSPQTESKIWAIFDIVCACLILIVLVYFLIQLKVDKEFLEAIVEQNKDNERDLKRFLDYSPLKQDLVITVVIVREFISILLGILLYMSAKSRIHHQLRIWLGSTFVAIIVDLFLFIPKMTFTQNKFLYVSTMIGYFMYKWYEVWVVALLFRDVRQDGPILGETNPTFETDVREYNDKPSQIGNNMGMILAEPPKKNRFRTNPISEITIVQTKSPVEVEQLYPVRY